jgi:hypothetical protein
LRARDFAAKEIADENAFDQQSVVVGLPIAA